MRRREFLAGMAAGVAALATAQSVAGESRPMARNKKNLKGLAEPPFRPLPLGSIRPLGWLERQLRIQAAGLSGHLDEFWPDVGQSQWFGGKAEGWERAPFWLDGLIPLAWTLDDPALKAKAERYVNHIISAQRPMAGMRLFLRTPRRAGTTCGPSCWPTRRWFNTTKPPATTAFYRQWNAT
jgi:hypothetical protein